MKKPRAFLALALVGALSAPRAGFAQPAERAAPRVRDALSGEALGAFDRARELFANGRYAEARAEFERAHALGGDPRVLYNVAVCDKELGRYARAAARLRQSLATTTLLPRDYIERARDTLELLAPYVGPLRVEVSEPGASVSVDGEDLGALPTREPLEVDIGRHVVTAWREGFYETSQAVDVPHEGRVVRLVLSPRPPAASPLPTTGVLQISGGAPENVIYVDGRLRGTGEHTTRVAPGTHRVRVVGAEGELYAADVFVREGETRTVSIRTPRGSEVPTWVWVAGGIVLAGAATATTLYLTRRVEYRGQSGDGPGGSLGTTVTALPGWSFP